MPTNRFLAILSACLALSFSLMTGAGAQSPRQRILLDANWRFLRESTVTDPRYAYGQPITNWEWTVASVDQSGAGGRYRLPAQPGDGATWHSATIGQDVFQNAAGFAWFRTKIAGSAGGPQAQIHFDSVDDNGWVYVNGVLVERHRGWDQPFNAPLGSGWKSGADNVILVLVQNDQGPGGLMKGTRLQSGPNAVVPKQAASGFNDRAWRIVHLPHDYIVEGKDDPNADGGHGFLPLTTAWYRKSFTLPPSDRGKSIWIDFDGVYRNAEVWLNGRYLGERPSGYSGFRFDISKWAVYGASKNELAVHVDPTHLEGWFYEGGGIYRHVWLNVADPLHFAPDTVFVQSQIAGRGPWPASAPPAASVQVQATVQNASASPQKFVIESAVLRPDGKALGATRSPYLLAPGGYAGFLQALREPSPKLWSLNTPQLYTLRTSIYRSGKLVDSVTTPFGMRTIRFDADKGFFLNGQPVKLQGTCNHQDFVGTGSGMPDSVLAWRVKKLKEMGCNAYRTSHNEVAAELLDACDRQGMLVMDESRHFGDTYDAKSPSGTTATDLSDLKQQISRDRNHPSVILWSIENEEPLQGGAEGKAIGIAMKTVVRQLDPTRPITAAMNGGWGVQGLSPVLDVQGFNYSIYQYDRYHAQFPNQPLMGSETASEVGSRGEYSDDDANGWVEAYDIESPRVGWGNTAQDAWEALATRPFMAGGFVWTGFDYKGEPTPYSWPDINSNFGVMDMCGFPKDDYYYYQAWWGDKPVAHILPHWNWPGNEGKPVPVWVFANGDQVELFLNGKSLGSKPMPPYRHAEWSVPYEAGTLVAKSYKNGKLIASDTVATTGAPAALRLSVDQAWPLSANGEDCAMVTAQVVDKMGRVVPTAGNEVHFMLSGPGHMEGVGDGNPSNHEPDKGSQRAAFNGLCLAVVQADDGGKGGTIKLIARSPGLTAAAVTITVR